MVMWDQGLDQGLDSWGAERTTIIIIAGKKIAWQQTKTSKALHVKIYGHEKKEKRKSVISHELLIIYNPFFRRAWYFAFIYLQQPWTWIWRVVWCCHNGSIHRFSSIRLKTVFSLSAADSSCANTHTQPVVDVRGVDNVLFTLSWWLFKSQTIHLFWINLEFRPAPDTPSCTWCTFITRCTRRPMNHQWTHWKQPLKLAAAETGTHLMDRRTFPVFSRVIWWSEQLLTVKMSRTCRISHCTPGIYASGSEPRSFEAERVPGFPSVGEKIQRRLRSQMFFTTS